jgi:hypothetical protein
MIRDMTARDHLTGVWPAPRTIEPREAKAHVTALRSLPEVLERYGVPSEPLLMAAGLRPEDLESPERSAAFAVLDQLLGVCAREATRVHFGLLVGKSVNLQSFGVPGRLAKHAQSVGAAQFDLSA